MDRAEEKKWIENGLGTGGALGFSGRKDRKVGGSALGKTNQNG